MNQLQNAHLTHKGNLGVGRHGWLRLTPAYSVKLVRQYVAELPPGSIVTDPFSGTGTTSLAAVEHGLLGQALDINPFLIWLGNVKTRHYSRQTLDRAERILADVLKRTTALIGSTALWTPPLANIARWWEPSALQGLAALRAAIDEVEPGSEHDLLEVAFCRTLIESSNAAFNHQSMSFKAAAHDGMQGLFELDQANLLVAAMDRESRKILTSAAIDLPGNARLLLGDSREMEVEGLEPCDLLLTSPPYSNRISYIRELRPYMYWLRYLDLPRDAGLLDWTAIGGTWGVATSNLLTWEAAEAIPITPDIDRVCAEITRDGGRNGVLLSNYVRKYFTDMWAHFAVAYKTIKSGGRAIYIVGNSTFYGHLVPTEQWYWRLLVEAGFADVTVTAIRKRNSNHQLFEYQVSAMRP